MRQLLQIPRRRGQHRRGADAAIAAVLCLCVAATVPDTQRLGDRLQVVLPLMAAGCSLANGEFPSLLGRYLLLEAGIKLPKFALGDHTLNQRPDGGRMGFPSGHTAAAAFGATALITSCGRLHPVTKGALILAAAFTGGSRIEAGRHTLWQTTAGAVWGWAVAVLPFSLFRRLRKRLAERKERREPSLAESRPGFNTGGQK